MTVLFWSSVLIFSAFALHLAVWKIRLPKRQTKTLLLLFFSVLSVGISVLGFIPVSLTLFGRPPPRNPTDFFRIALFFTSFTLAYMITYSALEADSPTLVMIMKIARSQGISKEDFFNEMSDEILVKPRIKDLLLDKMACLEKERYYLTPKGNRLARIFIFYRKLLKARKGG